MVCLSELIEENIVNTNEVNILATNKVEETTEELSVSDTPEQVEAVTTTQENLEIEASVISIDKFIEKNSMSLRYVKSLVVPETENVLCLKSINSNDLIIQLYKQVDSYMVFDLPCNHMQLYGENGFMIEYQPINGYVMKLYGTKTTVYVTVCAVINGELYPIHHFKSPKNKLADHVIECIEHSDIINIINENKNYDLEKYIILYNPFVKAKDVTNKTTALNWLIAKNKITFDVTHNIKIDNMMISIIRN